MKRRKRTEIPMLKVQNNNFICDTRLHCISRNARQMLINRKNQTKLLLLRKNLKKDAKEV